MAPPSSTAIRELWRIWPGDLRPAAGDWARSNIEWKDGRP